jgi:preprotein translocase subunit SecE
MNEQVRQQEGGASTAPLWIAAILVAAGVAGYYVLSTHPLWMRWGMVVAGLVAGGVVFFTSAGGRAFWRFVQDARGELRKVFWPTKQEAWITTALVFGFAVVMGAFFWLLDMILAWATKLLTGQGG